MLGDQRDNSQDFHIIVVEQFSIQFPFLILSLYSFCLSTTLFEFSGNLQAISRVSQRKMFANKNVNRIQPRTKRIRSSFTNLKIVFKFRLNCLSNRNHFMKLELECKQIARK